MYDRLALRIKVAELDEHDANFNFNLHKIINDPATGCTTLVRALSVLINTFTQDRFRHIAEDTSHPCTY